MKISMDVRVGRWPGWWTRVIIVLVIVLATAHWVPDAALPLGLGGWLASWLLDLKPTRQGIAELA